MGNRDACQTDFFSVLFFIIYLFILSSMLRAHENAAGLLLHSSDSVWMGISEMQEWPHTEGMTSALAHWEVCLREDLTVEGKRRIYEC